MTTQEILTAAAAVKGTAATLSSEERNRALYAMAHGIEASYTEILAANAEDVRAAQGTISPVMIDRLTVTEGRIRAMADGIRSVAHLPDPLGRVVSSTLRPNALLIEKTTVPIGLIAIIYESRPNVTSDAAALALKSGNVAVLRGGKEAYRTSSAIMRAMRSALAGCGLPEALLSLVEDTTHASATELMKATKFVDLLIPRGGAGLIRACVEGARVPCIQTGTGICHAYVDETVNVEQALSIIENAKTSRPSVCNALEVCLIHEQIAPLFLPRLFSRLTIEQRLKGLPEVEFRCDSVAAKIIGGKRAGAEDFDTEFLDYVLAVRIVPDLTEAINHISMHSTHHSDVILTTNEQHARRFTAEIDSAAVYVNASPRFTDGGEFGLGCEMGISTQKIHARGPMGLEELTTYKYIVRGNGQIR